MFLFFTEIIFKELISHCIIIIGDNMLAVYIILAIIFILFITVIILAIRQYNNEVVEKELEYVSENYDVSEIDKSNLEKTAPITPVKVEEQVTKPIEVPKEEVKVDNTPPPVIELKIPETSDEEIVIEDTAVKEDNTNDSIEIKDNALNVEETGEEIVIKDTSLNVEEEGEAAVTIEEPKEVTPDEVKPQNEEKDYMKEAFQSKFDGNSSINSDVHVEMPKEGVSTKTEIWDFSEIQKGVNSNEKN